MGKLWSESLYSTARDQSKQQSQWDCSFQSLGAITQHLSQFKAVQFMFQEKAISLLFFYLWIQWYLSSELTEIVVKYPAECLDQAAPLG